MAIVFNKLTCTWASLLWAGLSLSWASAAPGPGEIRLSGDRIRQVSASSESEVHERNRPVYPAAHLTDGRDWSAWGSTPRDRLGAWVEIGFSRVEYVSRLVFVPGDARNRSSFEGCGRPARVRLSTDQGERTFELGDKRWRQDLEISPPLAGRSLRVTVEQVHGRGRIAGVCISEMKLYVPRAILDALPLLTRQIEESLNELEAGHEPEAALARLKSIGRPALPAMLRRLDPDLPQRTASMLAALADLGDPQAIPSVTQVFESSSPYLQQHALLALVALGSSDHVDALVLSYAGSQNHEARRGMFSALARSGHPRALPIVLEGARSGSAPIRALAAAHLGRFGAEAMPHVSALRKSPDPHQRAVAYAALGTLATSPDCTPIGDGLNDEDGLVRGAALTAMSQCDPGGSVAELEGAVYSPFSDVRRAAAEALGRLTPPSGFDALRDQLLFDETLSVRLAAIAALGQYGLKAQKDLRRLALQSGDEASALAAAEAMIAQKPSGMVLTDLLKAWYPGVHTLALKGLKDMGVDGRAALLAVATGPNDVARKAALKHIDLDTPGTAEALLMYAQSAPPQALPDVLARLSSSKRPEAASVALQVLSHPQPPEVRAAAMHVFGQCGDPLQITPALVKGVADTSPEVRISAIESIGARKLIGAAEVLEVALLEVSPRPQRVAILQALGRIAAARSLDPLIEAYHRTFQGGPYDPGFRAEVVDAIGKIGGRESLDVLIDAALDREQVVRVAALKGLQ
ncbi:MAG: HEAT repeat domain-containing protein [Bradymonadia bacterium]